MKLGEKLRKVSNHTDDYVEEKTEEFIHSIESRLRSDAELGRVHCTVDKHLGFQMKNLICENQDKVINAFINNGLYFEFEYCFPSDVSLVIFWDRNPTRNDFKIVRR